MILLERTLSILKPDATQRNITGLINSRIEASHFRIIAQRRLYLTPSRAADFYKVHAEKPFFSFLCKNMSSGPIVAQVLERKEAVSAYRDLMGATDPSKAQEGTLRKEFGQSIDHNTVHGSDSLENAQEEIAFFFSAMDVYP